MAALEGRVAIVTGGAGGIGAAICEQLAEHGASVVVGYRHSQASAVELAARLKGPGPHVALALPVTDSAALHAGAVEVDRRYGRCDILVNCAGTTRFVPHADLDALEDSLIDEILATNVRGPFATVRAVRLLLERHAGALIVNISSVAAVSAMGSNVMYCASKAALDNITKSLARALAPAVRVVSISPGLVDTSFIKQLDQTWRDEQLERCPLRRLATPQEIGLAVVALYTGLTFTTGAIIPVDGGRQLY